jgi:hypothetical protein
MIFMFLLRHELKCYVLFIINLRVNNIYISDSLKVGSIKKKLEFLSLRSTNFKVRDELKDQECVRSCVIDATSYLIRRC